MSQEQLADRLEVTRQSVSKWESGIAMPELGKLIVLSEMFGVSVDYLVKDYLAEPEMPLSAPETARIEQRLHALEEDYHESLGTAIPAKPGCLDCLWCPSGSGGTAGL